MQSLMEFKGNLTVPNESESSSKTSKRAATLSTSRSDTDIRSVASLPDGVRIGTIMYFRKVQYIFSFLVFCLYTAELCSVPWYMYYRTHSMGTMVYVLPYPFVQCHGNGICTTIPYRTQVPICIVGSTINIVNLSICIHLN